MCKQETQLVFSSSAASVPPPPNAGGAFGRFGGGNRCRGSFDSGGENGVKARLIYVGFSSFFSF